MSNMRHYALPAAMIAIGLLGMLIGRPGGRMSQFSDGATIRFGGLVIALAGAAMLLSTWARRRKDGHGGSDPR